MVPPEPPVRSSSFAVGLTAMASLLLMLGGLFQFFQGLAAVLQDEFFVVTPNHAYALSVAAWGWVHAILGIALFVTGAALLLGQTWARVVGMVVAALSAVANFLYLPYYPVWAILVIALDVAVIWALCARDPNAVAPDRQA